MGSRTNPDEQSTTHGHIVTLTFERVAAVLQKMAAVETASAEERERLRATYKQRMQDMDARLKVVSDADKCKAAASAIPSDGRPCPNGADNDIGPLATNLTLLSRCSSA